ncbi:kinesin-like protein subito isoform X2 [Tribolium madens]|uniref:kinesin-like protein subito isoform X2 n=1 Tax=Tribolium madens TaxID=41895 RepID=UPI001CF72D2B|nr:kinesin-like protein subito isoform X2 [Tribolium madens]
MEEYDSLVLREASFLRARDPSILAFNRPLIPGPRTNLDKEFGEETSQGDDQPGNIRVFLRLKDGHDLQDLYQIDGNVLTSKVPPGSNFLRNIKEENSLNKMYTFTRIFDPQTTQRDVFNCVVKPKIFGFINGKNSTLFTYGASGSGKTFTVTGTQEKPGIVPRSLDYLFRSLPRLPSNPPAKPTPAGTVKPLSESESKKEKLLCKHLLDSSLGSGDRTQQVVMTYRAMQQRLSNEPVALLEGLDELSSITIWISYAEIYNEQIYDLLEPKPSQDKQRTRLHLGMSNGKAYIKNLSSVNVTSPEEAYQILQYGINNLNYASTQVNKHSSRSHSILTIKLVQISRTDGSCFVNCFNFCDLAGSERSKKTLNVGDRLKESNNINTSLLVLGRCISAVRNSQKANDNKLVPFRESKLTQLFQNALSGFEDIAMIVTINPSREMFDESQHVLKFSALASDIRVVERRPEGGTTKNNKNPPAESLSGDYSTEELYNMILSLQTELEIQKNEYETNLKIERQYLIDGYDEILQDQKNNAEQQVKTAEETVRRRYEEKLKNLQAHYEEKIKKLESQIVIELSSSSDEELSFEDKKLTSSAPETTVSESANFESYRVVEELRTENTKLKERIKELESELEKYRQQGVRTPIEEFQMSSDTYNDVLNLWSPI